PATLLGCRPAAELRLGAADRDPLAAIARFVAESPCGDATLPFPLAGGVVACLTYELGASVAPRRIRHAPVAPLAVLRRYDPVLVYDRRSAQYGLLSHDRAALRAPWLELLRRPPPRWDGPLGGAPLAAAMPAEQYRAAVRRILSYLAAGDCYQ